MLASLLACTEKIKSLYDKNENRWTTSKSQHIRIKKFT